MVAILETVALGMEKKERVSLMMKSLWLTVHDSWLSRQYVVWKTFSMFRRNGGNGDLINHARIFPMNSLRFFLILKVL